MRTKLFVWSSVALALVIAILLLLAAALHDPAAATHRRAIASMTRAEREELERKHQEYLKLPEAERRKLRELHDALQQDRTLSETRDRYEEWSNTLSPWQRLSLHEEGDPEKRLAIVNSIRREQQQIRERERERELERLQRQRFFMLREIERERNGAIRLDRSETEDMMARIAESLPESLRQKFDESYEGPERSLEMLIAALNRHIEHCDDDHRCKDDERCRDGECSRIHRRWPGPKLMSELVAEIEDEEERRWFESLAERGEGQHNLLASLSHAIDSGWWRWQFRRHFSEEQREEKYQQLEESERNELQKLSPDERSRALKFHLVADRREKLKLRFLELQQLLLEMEKRGGKVDLPEYLRESQRRTEGLLSPRSPRGDRGKQPRE